MFGFVIYQFVFIYLIVSYYSLDVYSIFSHERRGWIHMGGEVDEVRYWRKSEYIMKDFWGGVQNRVSL